MPASVAGAGDGEETRCERHGIETLDDALGAGLRSQFFAVNDAAAGKVLGELLRLSHIVAVRQKNMRDAAHFFEAPDQRRQKLGRVNEPVPSRARNEVAVAAEGFWGVETAIVDSRFEMHGKIRADLTSAIGIERADRSRRAGEQRPQRRARRFWTIRLPVHEGILSGIGEYVRS